MLLSFVTIEERVIDQGAGQADPTMTSPIVFEVVFSEPVGDFATGDVSLGGTAGATTVSGSGSTYAVSVTGMTQSGTVTASMPAGVAHDSANNPNDASTSTDNTVTFDSTPPSDPLTELATAIKKASPPLSAKLAADCWGGSTRSRRRSSRAKPARRAPSSASWRTDQEGSEYQAAGADERAGARLPEAGLGSEENDRLLTTIVRRHFWYRSQPDTLRTRKASDASAEERYGPVGISTRVSQARARSPTATLVAS
jgi:hypothetical protein